MSNFQRAHFDSENVTPDRPLIAYFNLHDKNTSTKPIFDSLISIGIQANAVRCLQRSHTGRVEITFSSSRYRERFLSRSSFVVNQRPVVVHPEHSPVTFVTVYDAPYELPDPALEYRLPVMHYQTMQGEFLSSPLNIRDANHSANKKSYVLGHLAASLFLL